MWGLVACAPHSLMQLPHRFWEMGRDLCDQGTIAYPALRSADLLLVPWPMVFLRRANCDKFFVEQQIVDDFSVFPR